VLVTNKLVLFISVGRCGSETVVRYERPHDHPLYWRAPLAGPVFHLVNGNFTSCRYPGDSTSKLKLEYREESRWVQVPIHDAYH
jgi:hypothetical protein